MTLFKRAKDASEKAQEAAEALRAVGMDTDISVRAVRVQLEEPDDGGPVQWEDRWDARVGINLDDAHELAHQMEVEGS